jgi:hypothetical protein
MSFLLNIVSLTLLLFIYYPNAMFNLIKVETIKLIIWKSLSLVQTEHESNHAS